jgi:tRNA(Arg) A34 adenosine deaminase TadA
MRDLAAWTGLTLKTPNPVPYGAEIVASTGGERLMRAPNTVGQEQGPSAHPEMRTIRLGSGELSSYARRGCTLSTKCETLPHVHWPVRCGLVWTAW